MAGKESSLPAYDLGVEIEALILRESIITDGVLGATMFFSQRRYGSIEQQVLRDRLAGLATYTRPHMASKTDDDAIILGYLFDVKNGNTGEGSV